MPTIDSDSWTTIASSQTDADSPVDEALMSEIRQNISFLKSWLGRDYLSGAVANHDHDGLNSSKVGGTGGAVIAVVNWNTADTTARSRKCEFLPTFAMVARALGAQGAGATSQAYLKFAAHTTLQSYNCFTGTNVDSGMSDLYYGGVGQGTASLNLTSAINGVTHHGILLADSSSLIATGTYAGNGTSQTVTTGFQASLVIVVENTSGAANPPTCRSFSFSGLNSKTFDSTGAVTTTGITSITATGFTVGSDNHSNKNAVNFSYIAIATGVVQGERIGRITWTGDGTTNRALTGLGFAPTGVMIFNTTSPSNSQGFATVHGMPAQGTNGWVNNFHTNASTNNINSWDSDGIHITGIYNTGSVVYDGYFFAGGTRYSTY